MAKKTSRKSAKGAKKAAARRVAAKGAKPRKAVARSSARKPTKAAAEDVSMASTGQRPAAELITERIRELRDRRGEKLAPAAAVYSPPARPSRVRRHGRATALRHGGGAPGMRRSLEESWRALEAMGHDMPRLPDGRPHLPSRMPNFDDDAPVMIAFFRTVWEDADLSGLTIPRMYFARSGFERVNFSDSELAESRMCWNDFIRCDFSNADLSRCDLRASSFDGCLFRGADLSGADLRRSNFDACIFEGAKTAGAIVHKRSASKDLIPLLSKAQLDEIRWVSEVGEEPPGG